MTVQEWLRKASESNESTDVDGVMMQNLLRKVGFPQAVVTCGIVYLEGYGHPLSIQAVASKLVSTGA